MGGVIRTIFNYGDVLIQTASEVPRIEFQAVSRPDKVAKILRELRVEEEQEKIEGRVR
jgi:membrane protein YdbS with pleckstrin-like domain